MSHSMPRPQSLRQVRHNICVHRPQKPARNVSANGFIDDCKDFFQRVQFENWAPRSSRAWRLRQYPSEESSQRGAADEEAFAASLEERMKRLSADARTVAQRADSVSPTASFSDSDDADITAALASRLSDFQDPGTADDERRGGPTTAPADADAPLTGLELIQLVEAKYGKRYDLTIARRTFAGKDFVSLNIMWVHLEQRSFPMSLEAFVDKMDGICLYLNAWNKAGAVREFMLQKPKGARGLPPRPIVGIAVPFQLDLPQSVIKEWLGDRLG